MTVHRRALCAALAALLVVSPLEARQGAAGRDSAELTGTVVDATSGDGVAGAFLELGDSGRRAIADADGRFSMADVPDGTHLLSVEAFGWATTVVEVALAEGGPHPPLLIRMEPDPVALSGLTVTGGGRIALAGTVTDEETGAPIPWASLRLSRDAMRDDARGSADDRGIFRLGGVAAGHYILNAERLGYERRGYRMDLTAPLDPIEVTLRADTALIRGIAEFDAERRTRRNASPFNVMTYDESRLRASRARGMRHFLEQYAFLVPCEDGGLCVIMKGRAVAPTVLIDNLIAYGGLDQLGSYGIEELYAVEVFRCMSSVKINAYTHAFIERMGRRPRLMLAACGFE